MDNITIRNGLFTLLVTVYCVFVYIGSANFTSNSYVSTFKYTYPVEEAKDEEPLPEGPKLEELDVKPFKHYPEAYNEDKLPSDYVENRLQKFTTARNYSLDTANCSETLILIKTARKNSKRRFKMRKELKKLKDINHYFMLGTAENGTYTDKLLAESDRYNDILIGNFIDSYYNLTIKSLSALQWSVDVCTETKSIILCDDDVHFNEPKVIRSLANIPLATIACLAMMKPSTIPVMRHGKWGVSREEYNRTTYPAYCIGPAIGFTRQAAEVILKTAKVTKSYKIDDVFISGILRYKAHLPIIRYKAVTFTRT